MLVKDLIRQRRLAKGLTMKELGKLVGVNGSTVSRWESGDLATMKQTKIKKLADALGLSPIDLLPPFPSEAEPPQSVRLTDDEAALLRLFRQLSPERRSQLLEQAEFYFARDNAAAAKKEA